MVSRKIGISGKVQGVGFRAATKKVADALGLVGTVRNLEEGSVEVVVEGDAERVFKLIDFCHHGPENALVDKVSVTAAEIANHAGFLILK